MNMFANEVERNAPITVLEMVIGAFASVSPIIGILFVGIATAFSGCKEVEVIQEDDIETESAEVRAYPESDKWWKNRRTDND